MTDKLVTLATFMYPTEAYPLMSKLESEGIECFLDGENTVTVMPFFSNAIGGVKLNIKNSDAEKALQILKQNKQYFEEKRKRQKKIPDAFSKGYVQVDTFCPECESINVYRKKFPLYKTILVTIFSLNWLAHLPLAFMVKQHYCADCGHVWKQ